MSSIRYANDLEVTELAREITNCTASMNSHLRDGHLDAAFNVAERMGNKITKLQFRLNDLKFRA